MSEIRRQDIASDDALQAPLILADGFKKAADNVDDLLALLKKLESNFGSAKGFTEMKDAVDEQTQAQKELIKIENQITTAKARNTVEYQNQQKTLATLKEAQRENNAEIRRSIQLGEQDARTANAQNSSKKQLQAALAANRAAYDKLTPAQRNNEKVGGELLKIIKQQDTEVKSLSDSMGDHTKHVGDYRGALQDALGTVMPFNSGLGGMTTGLGGAVKGLTTFRGALIAIPFVAVLTVITSLVSYFQRTEAGAQKLRIIMAALGQVTEIVKDFFSGLGEEIVNLSLEKVSNGFKNLGNSIKDFVLSRVELLMSGIKGMGEAFRLLFAGEFKESAKVAGQSLLDITRATSPVAMLIEAVVTNVDQLGTAFVNSYKKASDSVRGAIDLQIRENNLMVAKRDFMVEEEVIQNKINVAREKYNDRLLTSQERLDSILDAEKGMQELADAKVTLAQEELSILQARMKLSDTNEDDLMREAELKKEILAIENQRLAEQRRITSQRSTLEKQIEDEQIKALERIAKEEEQKAFDTIKTRDRALQMELAAIKQAAIDGRVSREEAEKQLVVAKRKASQEIIELTISQYENILEIENLSADERKKIDDELQKYRIKLNDELFNQINENQEELAQEGAISLIEIYDDLAMSISGILNGITQRRLQDLDREKREVEASYQAQIDAAEGNASYQEFLQNRLEAQREKIEEKKRKEQRKQAIFEKALSLGQSVINTAQGITAALATTNIPLAILVGILGAAQIAAIASQPIPEFAKGVKNFEGGPAIVGEEGTELIKSGNKFMLSPNKASIVQLPRGADVIPHDETMRMLASMPLMYDMQLHSNKPTQINDREMIKELKKISAGVNGTKGYVTYLDGQRISKNVNARNAIKAKIERRNRF